MALSASCDSFCVLCARAEESVRPSQTPAGFAWFGSNMAKNMGLAVTCQTHGCWVIRSDNMAHQIVEPLLCLTYWPPCNCKLPTRLQVVGWCMNAWMGAWMNEWTDIRMGRHTIGECVHPEHIWTCKAQKLAVDNMACMLQSCCTRQGCVSEGNRMKNGLSVDSVLTCNITLWLWRYVS